MLLIIVSGPCISATLCPLHSLPAVDCALPADLAAAKPGQLNFGDFAYFPIGGNTAWSPVKAHLRGLEPVGQSADLFFNPPQMGGL